MTSLYDELKQAILSEEPALIEAIVSREKRSKTSEKLRRRIKQKMNHSTI